MGDAAIARIQVGCGTAKGQDALTVGADAARQAMRTVTEYGTSVVLVFASVKYDLPALLKGIRSVIPGAPLLGTTTAGEICGVPLQESVVVVVLASPYLQVRVGLGKGVSRDWRAAVAEAVNAPALAPFFAPHDGAIWAGLTRDGKAAWAMLFSPGNTRQADSRSYWILEELKRLSEGLLPIFGGSSADDWRLESNAVFLDGEVHADSVLVAVFETSLRFGIGLSHGFAPGEERATVAAVRDNDVLTLDNQPAADVYARLLGFSRSELEGKHLTLTTGRPVGTPDPYGQFSINVASFFTPEGGVRLAQPVREGTSLIIMEPDKDRVVAAGQEAVRKAVLRGGISAPAICLVFSCALRPRILAERTAEEIGRVVAFLPNTPVAGFYSFGEQGVADDGVNRHNNVVVAVLVLSSELTRAAEVAIENRRLLEALDQDVAQRERAEESLRDHEEALRATLDSTADGILAVDDKGRVIFANKRFARMWHIPPDLMDSGSDDELLGFVLDQLIDPGAFLAKVRELYGSVREDFDVLRFHDGRVFERYSRPLARGNALAGRVWSFRDVTERERAEEERRKLETHMQHVQKLESLGLMAGGIAHDFNNLLMAILGNADLAAADLPCGHAVHEYLHEIENAARNAAELCRQMLAYSGKGHFVAETLSLNDVITEMAHLLQVSIPKKVTLQYHLAKDLPAVHADPTQVRQVIMNLITNASEAIGSGNGVVSITTGAKLCDVDSFSDAYFDKMASEGVYVFMEVVDTGCGMDAATCKRIFDPFFTTKVTGRGLGLAAVLGIVRGHKGAVRVQSQPGEGTTFQVFFPVASQTDRPRAKRKKSAEEWRGSGTVLLVDDEEVIRLVGSRMLSRLGFEVLIAGDGHEALTLFREHAGEVVCVLLDLTMPRVDGEETLRALREVREDVRVIVISGHAEREVASRFRGMRLSGFIHKPFSLEDLVSKLRNALKT